MFGIDFNELLLIAVVALVVLGPEKLPGAARTAGALVRRARTAWASVQAEVAGELDKDELTRHWREGAAALRGVASEARATLGEARESLRPAVDAADAADAARAGMTEVSAELARSIGELRTLAARLDGAAGAERDALRAVAADLRAAADQLAATPEMAADAAALADATAPATLAVAQSLTEIAQRLQQVPAATLAVAPDADAPAARPVPTPPHSA